MKGLIALAVAGFFAAAGLGGDQPLPWPQFRGPGGSGIAEGQKPPVEFGPEKNVKWKVEAPGGLSSPIVAGPLLVMTAFDHGKLYTVAYHRADGKEAWRAEAPAKEIEAYYKIEGSPAASTPATDGERIVSYFGSCGLVCYNLAGKELWRFEIPTAQTAGKFGSGVSPIVAGGMVILVRDVTKDSKIIALDAATGSRRWEKPRQSAAGYCTPVVWDTPGGKQVVAAGHGRMIAYDLQTGAEKWFVPGMPNAPCSSAVTADGVLYFAGWAPGGPDDKQFQLPSFDAILKDLDTNKDGVITKDEVEKSFMKDFFDATDANGDGKITRDEWDALLKHLSEGVNSAFAVKPGGSGDITDTHILWKKSKGLPYVSTAIAYRGQYLMVKDGGIVTAYDMKTGNELYHERIAASGRYYASPVAANGHIYFLSQEDGGVTVLKAGSEKPEVVAKNVKLGEKTAATPAIADDTMYVRTERHLYAFAEKK